MYIDTFDIKNIFNPGNGGGVFGWGDGEDSGFGDGAGVGVGIIDRYAYFDNIEDFKPLKYRI